MADLTKFMTNVFYKHGVKNYNDPLGEARYVLNNQPDHSLQVTADGKVHQVYQPQGLLDPSDVYNKDQRQQSAPLPSRGPVRGVDLSQDTIKKILNGGDEDVDDDLFPELRKPEPNNPAVTAVISLVENLTENEIAWLETLTNNSKQVAKAQLDQALQANQPLHLERISPPNQKVALVRRELKVVGTEKYIVFSLSLLGKAAFEYIITQGKDKKIKDNLVSVIKQSL